MTVSIDTASQVCRAISRQVRDSYKNLTLHYIVHYGHQRLESFGLAGQEIMYHPAAESGIHLLATSKPAIESTMIGLAVARQKLFLGLASKDSLLALCSFNIDSYQSLPESRRHAYHLAWHAIDSCEYHSNPDNGSGKDRTIITRRRNTIQMASANLRADVFAGIMCTLQGDTDALGRIAKQRAKDSLRARAGYHPENYPFIIAADAVSTMTARIKSKPTSKNRQIGIALQGARELGLAFEEKSIRHWLSFSEPAQEMAWQGFSESEILGAAINTSDDTYVRATGYLVSEATGIKPASILELRDRYSPFADNSHNRKVHDHSVDKIFEDVIAQGLRQKNIIPFLDMANTQNQKLAEGYAVGWCAAPLQASAKAFQNSLAKGTEEAEWAARREFEDTRTGTGWDVLKTLSSRIIKVHRNGDPMTLADLEDLCKTESAYSLIGRSVNTTAQNLSSARTQEHSGPRPRSPAPAVAPRIAPAAPTISGPGLGMGSSMSRPSSKTASIPPQQEKTRTKTDEGKEDRAH